MNNNHGESTMSGENITGAEMLEQLHATNAAIDLEDLTPDAAEDLGRRREALVGTIATAAEYAEHLVDSTGVEFSNPLAEALGSDTDQTEASPELQERLDALPESMRAQAVSAHEQRTKWNNTYIKDGSLPEEYAIPGLEMFIDRLEALVPTFKHMEANDKMKQQIVFPQRNLADVQRKKTFACHDKTKNGFYRNFSEDAVVDPTGRSKHFPEDMLHDVAVIDASDKPTYVSVSKDGKKGKNTQAAVTAARELPTVDAVTASDEDVLAQATTSQDIYDALQLGRLERGKEPVDARTWTLTRENATIDGDHRAVWTDFDPGDARLGSYWDLRGRSVGAAGVRFAASGQEALALHPSTS